MITYLKNRAGRRLCNALSALILSLHIPSTAFADSVVARLPRYSVGQGDLERTWILVDSRWGYLPRYNLALARRLESCTNADPSTGAIVRIAPERFSATTAEALKVLAACLGTPVANTAALENLFAQLLPEGQPTVLERAHVLASRASPLTPDYDRTFWDMTGDGHRRSADPDSLFTWGPYRATAGQGCTLQTVLVRLAADEQTASALREAFLPETPLLEGLLGVTGCSRARQLLQPLASDPTRRERLQLIFAQLADLARVREVYDQVFYGRNGKRLRRIQEYLAAWKAAGRDVVTEIDFAFFLERSLQYPALEPGAIAKFAAAVPRGAEPWQVRKIASEMFNFPQPGPRSYQSGRDATYFIDGALQRDDRADFTAWVAQSRVRAADVGLTDRPFKVCEVMPLCEGDRR